MRGTRRRGWVAGLLLIAGPAAADEARSPTVTASVGLGGGQLDTSGEQPPAILNFRATLGWAPGKLAYPEPRRTRSKGALIPEAVIGMAMISRAAPIYVAAGGRLNLAWAQRSQGLLQISARGDAWLGSHLGVIGDDNAPFVDVTAGTTLWFGRSRWFGGLAMTFMTPIGPAAGDDPWLVSLDLLLGRR